MNFGERLAMLRRAKGVLLKEVAGYVQVTVPTMSNYEKGVHQPDFDTLCKLADYYGVSTDYLLGRSTCVEGSGGDGRQHLSKRREKIFFEMEHLSDNNLHTMEKMMHIMKNYEISVIVKQ